MVCSKAAENTTPSSSRPGVCGPEQRLGSLRWWGQQPRARAPWKGGGGGSSTPTLALPECRELEAHNLGTVYMCSRSPELSHEHLKSQQDLAAAGQQVVVVCPWGGTLAEAGRLPGPGIHKAV